MSAFDAAVALAAESEGEHRLVVPDGWQQGRGAFGGLVLGALAAAMAAREPERPLRALTGEICGPVLAGAARITSRVLRRGNNQTNVAADLAQDGVTLAVASAVFANARSVAPAKAVGLASPPRPAWDDARELPIERLAAGPRFARNYEYRPTGLLPFSGGDEPLVLGWVREREPLARVTAAALLARIDAYWPAIFSVDDAPRPCATVSFMAEILRDPATLDPRAPLFYRGRAVAQAGGYFVEMRELWDGDALVALNQQSFAILA